MSSRRSSTGELRAGAGHDQRSRPGPQARPAQAPPRPAPYALRGCVWYGICKRRILSHWANAVPYCRCRFPAGYALANHVEHPLNANLREDAIIGQVDDWLTPEFAPHRLTNTIRDLATAQQPDITRGMSGDDEVACKIANCDTRLAQYRAALDAGANSATVAAWIAETEAECATYELAMRWYDPRPHRMSEAEIMAIVDKLADIARVLCDADPGGKERSSGG
jgi:site-specific DNA recombinase